MAGKWGSSKNGIAVGFFYDSIQMNAAGTQARIVGGRIRIRRGVNIVDSTNSLSWSGGAVSDGSSSNLNLNGSGDKTIKSVTGQWQTLSTTTPAVKATASVSLSGVNYAGGTLTVSVTVTYPLAGDGGTVSPTPSPGGEAWPNPWADESAPDFATEPYVESIYAVRLPAAPADLRLVPAWDVQVDLDGGRAPYGSARFKAPTDWLTEDNYAATNPRALPVVQIDAGWRYPGRRNMHTLFSGVITERSLRVDSSGAYVEFVAESYETILDYPSSLAAAVNNAHTSVKQTYDSLAFYRKPTWVEPAWNVPPDTAPLAEFRAMAVEKDDDVADFLRTCASTLIQWMRGAMDTSTPTIECVSDPYPYQRLVELDIAAFDRLDRVENLDQWANILRLTTQWTNGSGDTVNKRRVYTASTVTTGTGAVKAKDVTLNVKPPSGATPPATWAPALRWLRRVNEASRGSWSGQCRALWWLQPRVDGVMLKGSPIDDTGGQVQRVTYLVDQGLMQLTWNVVHA